MVGKNVAVVGSREFKNYAQLSETVNDILGYDDEEVSGGAGGADSLAQRFAKEYGRTITIVYPKWEEHGIYDKGAGFKRNKIIVEKSKLVLAFYAKDRFQQGGTANTAEWAKRLDVPLLEFKEE